MVATDGGIDDQHVAVVLHSTSRTRSSGKITDDRAPGHPGLSARIVIEACSVPQVLVVISRVGSGDIRRQGALEKHESGVAHVDATSESHASGISAASLGSMVVTDQRLHDYGGATHDREPTASNADDGVTAQGCALELQMPAQVENRTPEGWAPVNVINPVVAQNYVLETQIAAGVFGRTAAVRAAVRVAGVGK